MNQQNSDACEPNGADVAVSRDTPPTTAGARAQAQYQIDANMVRAIRISKRLLQSEMMFGDDAELVRQLQRYLKTTKKINNYKPNYELELFPP